MAYSFGHLALFVHDLHQEEAFYRQAFGLEVLFREAEGEDGTWGTLPAGKGWEEADAAGIEIGMVALGRDGFVLPLFPGRPPPGAILEIGIVVPPEEIEPIRSRLPDGAVIRRHEYDDLIFEDPFGFVWHVNGSDDGFLSNGEIAGQWVDL